MSSSGRGRCVRLWRAGTCRLFVYCVKLLGSDWSIDSATPAEAYQSIACDDAGFLLHLAASGTVISGRCRFNVS